MLYVDGMNGVIGHAETIQWLYTLVGSKVQPSINTRTKKEKKQPQHTRTQCNQAVVVSELAIHCYF